MEELKREILNEMWLAAIELAEYASYAEIVGGIHHNREAIRKRCDRIFEIMRKEPDPL